MSSIKVDRDRCKGCELCVSACPQKIIGMSKEMNAKGFAIDTILACGGGTKNPVFLREHADATGCRILLPREPEAVLLGSAILGSVAAGRNDSVMSGMAAMAGVGESIKPSGGNVAQYFERKSQVFKRMYEDQMTYRDLMNPSS